MKKIVIIIQLAILLIVIIINYSFLHNEFFSKIGLNIISRGETSLSDERVANLSKNNKKDIVIGVAAPIEELRQNNHLFIEGIEYATELINTAGGINNRKVKLIIEDDKNLPDNAMRVADKLSRNLDVAAVIGHPSRDTAVPSAVIYDFNGVLLITPAIHSPKLGEEVFSLIFWNTPPALLYANIISKYIIDNSCNSVLFITSDTDSGYEISNHIMSTLYKYNVNIADNIVFDLSSRQEFFDKQINSCTNLYKIDAVVLTDYQQEIIKALKKKNYQGLIIIVGLFEHKTEVDKQLLEGVIFPVLPEYDKHSLENFREGFVRKYKNEPDSYAIKGYETATLLFEAMKIKQIPKDLAHTLKNNAFNILGRKIQFDKNGILFSDSGSDLQLKKIYNGTYVDVFSTSYKK